MLGLSSWVIADGNYPHFKHGQRASFVLTFYAPGPLSLPSDTLSIDPAGVDRTSMQHLEGSEYLVTAKVTHVESRRMRTRDRSRRVRPLGTAAIELTFGWQRAFSRRRFRPH